jgi:putative MATE family efflux protein
VEETWKSYKGLWALSIPSIIAMMLEPISSVVDTALVGRFSTQHLAALAIGATLISSLTWVFNFLVHAPIQGVSDRIGKKQYDEVISLCKISLSLALGLGLLLIIIFYPIRFEIYRFMGAREELLSNCDDYFLTRLLGQSFILLFTVCLSLLRGFAKVRLAMAFIGVSTFVNVTLSYLSLYHFDLGLQGVAASTVIGNAIGFLMAFIQLINAKEIKQRFWKQRIILKNAFEIGQNSFNIFLRSFFLTSSFFICTKVASGLGIKELAAYQIMLQIWLFASFFTDGLATTGNIIGARAQLEIHGSELKLIFRKLLIMGLKIGVLFTISYLVFDRFLITRFTTDEDVIAIILSVWPLIALTQAPLSLAYVYDGLIFGLGDFSFLRKHMMIAFTLLFMPCIYLAYAESSFLLIWIGLVLIGLYRLLSNYFCVKKTLEAHI